LRAAFFLYFIHLAFAIRGIGSCKLKLGAEKRAALESS
jgi:hypothetical protein